jgi:hypothetical protein
LPAKGRPKYWSGPFLLQRPPLPESLSIINIPNSLPITFWLAAKTFSHDAIKSSKICLTWSPITAYISGRATKGEHLSQKKRRAEIFMKTVRFTLKLFSKISYPLSTINY